MSWGFELQVCMDEAVTFCIGGQKLGIEFSDNPHKNSALLGCTAVQVLSSSDHMVFKIDLQGKAGPPSSAIP
jgi:hypothetical protein